MTGYLYCRHSYVSRGHGYESRGGS